MCGVPLLPESWLNQQLFYVNSLMESWFNRARGQSREETQLNMHEEGNHHTGIQLPGALDSKKVICRLQNKQLISTSIAVVHPF